MKSTLKMIAILLAVFAAVQTVSSIGKSAQAGGVHEKMPKEPTI